MKQDANGPRLSLAQAATLACLLEVTAPKVGNVHRGVDFENLRFEDFVTSAVVSGPIIAGACGGIPVGETIYRAVEATRKAVATNTNLGTLLLLAPLAAVPRDAELNGSNVERVLAKLDAGDAAAVYEAIRLAHAGGLGKVEKHDVASAPPESLLDAMRLAADRDLVARQYVTNFEIVLTSVVPALLAERRRGSTIPEGILYVQQQLLAEHIDSLIARKCGPAVAEKARQQAQIVVAAGRPGEEDFERALSDFDFWLRSDGHRRNPGTTADLIAAGLFAVLRDDDGTWLATTRS